MLCGPCDLEQERFTELRQQQGSPECSGIVSVGCVVLVRDQGAFPPPELEPQKNKTGDKQSKRYVRVRHGEEDEIVGFSWQHISAQ